MTFLTRAALTAIKVRSILRNGRRHEIRASALCWVAANEG